jgi:hypothetical protein
MTASLAFALSLLAGFQEQDAPPPAPATRLQHEKPHFRATIPAGFVPLPELPPSQAYAFSRVVAPDKGNIIVSIQILDGKIGRETLSEDPSRALSQARAKLPPGSDVKIGKARWSGFDLQVIETRVPRKEGDYLAFAAQIPLLPVAIQISMVGKATLEEDMRRDLAAILSTTTGTTDWLTDRQRMLAWVAGISTILAWTLLAAYGLAHLVAWKGKPRRLWRLRLSWLAILTVLFVTGYVTQILNQMSKKQDASLGFMLPAMAVISIAFADRVRRQAKEQEQQAPDPLPADPGQRSGN